MKKTPLILLLTAAAMLASCSQGGNSASSSSEKKSPSSDSISSNASSSGSESKDSSSEALHVLPEMVGRWYIYSSSAGVLPINGIFDIADDDTLAIGEVVLSLAGNYAGFDDTYLFTYGTIQFIVSYDAEKKGLDWGYQNVDTYDFGFATSTPVSDGYDYESSDYPMAMINEYIGTSGEVPAYASSTYKLKLFNSSLNNKPSGDLEIPSTSLLAVKAYLDALVDGGYTFPTYSGETAASTFYVGYDADKVYTLRIIYFADDQEAHVFYYAYDATLLPKGADNE